MRPVDLEASPTTPRGEARTALATRLARAGIVDANLEARVLVCAACGIDHAGLIRDPEAPLGPAAAATLADYAARRLAHEPVSRILGRREFWGLPLTIGPAVLDPRPETEGVVGAVLDAIGGRRATPLRLLDLGTGSGALLCALLRELPGAFGIGLDRSAGACRVARGNLEALGLTDRAAILCGTWADALDARFDVVVSNPPYIPSGELAGLDPEVREHDPALALDGGPDGFAAYRAIAPRFGGLLAPGGVAALECGWNQGEAVATLLRGVLSDVMIYKDLTGHDRVVLGIARDFAER